jgi:hypothetical protein
LRAVPPADRYRTAVAPLADPALRAAWARLAEGSEQRSPFADLRFADAYAAVLGWPARLALTLEGETARAGAVLFDRRRGPYRALALPPLAACHSVLLDRQPGAAEYHYRRSALDALLARLADEAHQATFALHHSLNDARPFAWRGWAMRPAYTYVVPLASGDLTAAWSSTHRHAWRKHRAAYDCLAGAEHMGAVMALVEASHERQRQPLGMPRAALREVVARLADSGLATPMVALRDGEAEAGLVLLQAAGRATYWVAGSRPGPAMTVLLGEAIHRARDAGAEEIDLAGANTPSIAEFKRKFGGRLETYFRARLVTRPELRLLDALRQT